MRIVGIWSLFGLLLAFGLLYTPAPAYGLNKILGYLTLNLGPSVIALLVIHTEDDMARLMKAVLIVGLLSTVIVILATIQLSGSLTGIGEIWQTKIYFYVFGTKVDLGIWFGRRMALLMITALVVMSFFNQKKYQRIAFFLVFGFLYLSILAGARGPCYFGLLAGTIVAFLLAQPKILKAVFAFGSIAIICFVIGKYIFYKPVTFDVSHLPMPTEIRGRYDAPLEDAGGSWAIRLNLFRSAIDVFIHNPIIGVGTGGWSYEYYGFDTRDYPHNIFLEIASELGIIGLIVFCLFLGLVYRAAKITLKGNNKSPPLYLLGVWGLGITLIGFFNAQVSGDIHLNDYLWFGSAILTKVGTWSEIIKRPVFIRPMPMYRFSKPDVSYKNVKFSNNWSQ